MISGFYKLVDGKPVKGTIMEYARFVSSDERLVKQTTVNDILISTVFLGIANGLSGGKPLLWETMIFRGGRGCELVRATSKKKALRNHYLMKGQLLRVLKRGH
ncbi:hypothetical protein LZS85_15630 [Aliivibrio fischeri]|uniref:hypothetical protein n=1 Tax=Aliivibrio fischeri TaxID=668 RepID=UPI001F319466|nr:hypothetical protein [Aliivibrio fischeri]MCE7567554.1 hypothetical protein [Aliivibrio fischeri]